MAERDARERGQGGRTKLVDAEVLRKMRDTYELYSFGVAEELILDVTKISPEDAAVRIYEWAMKVSRAETSQQQAREDTKKAVTESLLY